MTKASGSAAVPGRAARARRAAAPEAAAVAEDQRFAALHLRLGGLSLARAELEDLLQRGALDGAGLADLAEARWRSGDLEGAAVAAVDHLATGGVRPIASVIAAEAAAAIGRPVEARAHVEALGALDAAALDRLFSGMPRRAFWPSAPVGSAGLPDPPTEADRPRAGRATSRVPRPPAEPTDELSRARAELSAGTPDEASRGVARLALVLRLDPALTPAVLDALRTRRDPAALLVRGDAYRLLGRHLEAEAALHAAGQALDARDEDGPA